MQVCSSCIYTRHTLLIFLVPENRQHTHVIMVYIGNESHSLTIFCCPDPAGCINGFLTVTELRSMWESRTRPVLYSSPDREITLDCSGPGFLSKILVGAYITGTGDVGPRVEIGDDTLCDLSTLHATEHLNVYGCVLESDPPVEIDSVHVVQRYTTSLISFLHDGQTDTPLISVITSKLLLYTEISIH